MTDQLAVVEFTTPDPLGSFPADVDITSVNITETFKAAVLIFTRITTDDSNQAHGVLGLGFLGVDGDDGAGSVKISITAQIENASAVSDNNVDRGDAVIQVPDGLGVGVGNIDILAATWTAIAGGVRLTFSQGDVQAKCSALLFAGVAKAATGNAGWGTVESHEDVGAAADQFEPDLVIFRASDGSVSGDTTTAATLALGFALNLPGIPQVSSYINWDDGANPTDSDGYIRSDCASSAFSSTLRTAMDRAQVTSFDSTGFNGIGILGGVNTPQANYLAIKWDDPDSVDMAVTNLSVSSSTGTQAFTVGFPPDVVLGMSTLLTSLDTLTDGPTASAAGHFLTGRFGGRAYSIHNREGLALGTTDAHTRQGDHAVLTLDHLGAVAQQASWVGGTAGGFELNFSTATAGYLTVLAIGLALPAVIATDTESITESTPLYLGLRVVATDTETISDEVVLSTYDVTGFDGPQGTTFQAGSERGTSFQARAEAGTVL